MASGTRATAGGSVTSGPTRAAHSSAPVSSSKAYRMPRATHRNAPGGPSVAPGTRGLPLPTGVTNSSDAAAVGGGGWASAGSFSYRTSSRNLPFAAAISPCASESSRNPACASSPSTVWITASVGASSWVRARSRAAVRSRSRLTARSTASKAAASLSSGPSSGPRNPSSTGTSARPSATAFSARGSSPPFFARSPRYAFTRSSACPAMSSPNFLPASSTSRPNPLPGLASGSPLCAATNSFSRATAPSYLSRLVTLRTVVCICDRSAKNLYSSIFLLSAYSFTSCS